MCDCLGGGGGGGAVFVDIIIMEDRVNKDLGCV